MSFLIFLNGFEDLDHPNKVYKVVKALYGLHQALRAWYETLANYLLENGFHRGQIDQTLFIKKQKEDILLVQIYVDDNIFGATNKDLCKSFEKLMTDKFQMSSIRELTFSLGLQVKQKKDGIFISQDKYIAEILKKFRLTKGKSASTPIDTEKPLLKDPDGEDVDVHIYRSMIGSLMYLTSSRPDIMFADSPFDLVAYSDSDYAGASLDKKSTTRGCQFLGCRLISWQCTKQTVVATSSTEAKYVAGTSCCAQVLWIQNQMLDYRIKKVKTLKLKRLRKVGTSQRVDTSNDTLMEDVSSQGRMIDELDKDEGDVLMNEKGETKEVRDNTGDAQVEGRQAGIYQIDIDHAAKVLSMQEDESEVQEAVEVVTTAKLITEVVVVVSETVSAAAVVLAVVSETVSAAAVPTVTAGPFKVVVPSTRRRRGMVIRDPEESSAKTPTETKSKDKGKGIMVEEPKPIKKKQQVELDEAYARKLQEELNRDIDWEVAIDHVKQKAKEDPFIQRYQPTEEGGMKKLKMLKKSNSIRKIMPDEDDDVYTKATPLARKVPVVDYQIVHFNNKPHFKIIRADGTHQLYVSFITLLKNFDREDIESLWSLVKERFSTPKPNSFSDDYLLTTLRAMFGRPDGQDLIWKNQRNMILLVERRYPQSRFTLDQMLNTVRLQVEEQSEMSWELIRFTRQQLQEGQHN
uniref:Putative ribonuclease H-like domain-containing protein n=1 Tax=Tanacetum cinerariifolium TaxID=118510 RepID=A0A699H1Z4_TANCI|nr:putative ribonuclease H-like domain-containing protein [Tanacetum cinerariifolium]